MKSITIPVCGLVAIALSCIVCSAANPPSPPASRPAPTTASSSGDAATDLVASFYGALLQDGPVTREQELALFPAQSGMRYTLASTNEELSKADADRELRRRLEAQAAAAGPLVLTYFRQHRDWFLPVPMTSPRDIMISSRFHLIRSVEKARAGPPKQGGGFVLVVVNDTNDQGQVVRVRTIVFTLRDGKIIPGQINLDGFGFREAETMLLQERTGLKPPGG